MEVTVARFSRPIIIKSDSYSNGDGYYQTIYGFIIPGIGRPLKESDLNDYVGYLAGLSCIANGHTDFTINYEERGCPDWCDKKGFTHTRQDRWMERTEQKCRQRLNLNYDLLEMNMSEDDLSLFVNESNLVVDEVFYYDMKRFLGKDTKPLVVGDYELPL